MNLPILTFDETTATSIAALTAALTRVADNQDRLLAGQEAALAKIDGPKTTTRRSSKKDETPATETAPTSEPQQETAKKFLPEIPTDEASTKAYVGAWTGAVEGDARAARVALLKAIAAHFAVAPNFAALAGLGAEKLKQIVFFIERDRAGQKVDFGADYDFDGDPAQGGATPAADDDGSDFG